MTFWEGKNVLVTGANGFTGSNLCAALLEAGANVRAFVKRGGNLSNILEIRNNIEVMRGDLTDYISILKSMEGIGIVFHSGAIVPVIEARDVPNNTAQVNAIGTLNVALAALNKGVKKMVYTSTCHVYGNQPPEKLPLTENTRPNPADIYSATKYAGEILISPFVEQGLGIIITRSFNKYGPGQRGNYFIPTVITQVLKCQTPKLGNPNPTRDYIYIGDAVRGYMLTAELGKQGEIYHFSSGKETRMGDLCDKILEACDAKNLEPIWETNIRTQDISRSYGDSSKARKEFGWEPKIDLDVGLRRTVDWWRAHPEILNMQFSKSL